MALKRRTILIVSLGALLFVVAIVLVLLFSVRNTEQTKREGLFGFVDSVNPFNSGDLLPPAFVGGEEPLDEPIDTTTGTTTLPRLRKLTSGPVAGYTSTTTANGLSLRYIERKTGHVYDASLTEEKVTRVTNSTIPRVEQAALLRNGVNLLFSYLGSNFTTVNTLSGTVSDASAYLGFSQLSNEMASYVSSPTKNTFAAFSWDETGGRISLVATSEKVIYRSPVKKWAGSWSSPTTLVVYPSATAAAAGAVYTLSESGSLKRLVGNKNGLEAVGWGDWFILSFTEGALQTQLYNRATETWLPLSITTLAEKCVFSTNTKRPVAYCGVPNTIPNGTYPDLWHEGRVAFKDSLWSIDTTLPDISLLTNLPEDVDAVRLTVTEDGKYLAFMNRRDGSLWVLRLFEE